ncbi:MAG: dihydropteroate synthase [Candidatus Methylomirabilales bacterium]
MIAYGNLAGVELGKTYPVRILGVINVSPESFYPGSVPQGAADLRDRAERMAAEGADLLDIGAMSTAPYKHTAIPEEEEAGRLVAAIQAVRSVVSLPISADTSRASVAQAALDAGARVINDVSGLRGDPGMGELAAKRAEGLIVMASPRGHETPEPVETVRRLLSDSLRMTWKAGIPAHRIVIDPGIGFFRNTGLPWDVWDCEVLRRLEELGDLGQPVAVGVSRKSFLGKLLGKEKAEDRLAGSLAATVVAVLRGAHLIRTHDVAATRDAIRVAEALA